MTSIERLHELFSVDDSGRLTRRCSAGAGRAGAPAGWLCGNGYLYVSVDSKKLLVHRVVYAMQRGDWPERVDHVNGDPLDNRLENLRAATHAQNQQNRGKNKNNTTGFKGVTRGQSGRYVARITANGRIISLGEHATPEAAASAYAAAAEQYHGAFARAA